MDIIKIMVFSIFLMLNSNFKNLNAFIILFKEIKNGEDTKLYLIIHDNPESKSDTLFQIISSFDFWIFFFRIR